MQNIHMDSLEFEAGGFVFFFSVALNQQSRL
jgi:hypothetical protein